MSENLDDQRAWQPFTFGGAARFAYAPTRCLWLLATVVAAICGAAVTWFLAERWAPQIEQAISKLPEESSIRDGSLRWPTREASDLAQNAFLAIYVQPGPAREIA